MGFWAHIKWSIFGCGYKKIKKNVLFQISMNIPIWLWAVLYVRRAWWIMVVHSKFNCPLGEDRGRRMTDLRPWSGPMLAPTSSSDHTFWPWQLGRMVARNQYSENQAEDERSYNWLGSLIPNQRSPNTIRTWNTWNRVREDETLADTKTWASVTLG